MKVVCSDPDFDQEQYGDEHRRWDRGVGMLRWVLVALARVCGVGLAHDQRVFENQMSR
jgi:hypothetical protein